MEKEEKEGLIVNIFNIQWITIKMLIEEEHDYNYYDNLSIWKWKQAKF